ncbi:MAG: hypothetical protein JNK82_13950 [Myxococcaceae bacterium]|nr:hypothetical protein [Myxococcaceae bacterium]
MRRFSVIGVVALAGCSGAGPATRDGVLHIDVSATCAGLNGAGEVRRARHPYWEPLGVGTPLKEGDWVRTLGGAAAQLELLAGGRLDVAEKSVVVIEPRATASEPTRVAIEEGELRATLTSAITVRRPGGAGQVLLAPAVYRVAAPDGPGMNVEVTRLAGDEPPVPDAGRPAGVRASPRVTSFPSSVSPGIDARLKFDPRGWVKLTWSSVAGAARYRVQTARDWSFTQELKNADVEGTSWLMRPDGLGLHVWRVAAVGAGGELGEFGYARRLFLEAETPTDLLVSPADGFTSTQAGVTFSWEARGGSYRVMVSKGSDPQRQPVFNEVTSLSTATVSALAPGTYSWGVYQEGSVLKPLFLKPRRLVVGGAKK